MSAWTLALQQWQAHDAIVFVRSDPAAMCRAIADWKATRINAIPAVWQRILDHLDSPDGADAVVTSMRFCDTGTSATPLALLAALMARFPEAQVRVFYGSTEAGAVTAMDHDDVARKPGSCGVPAIWMQLRTADDGELQVRGPLVFDGYFEDPEATAAAFTDDGWFRSGDLASVDDEGFISIVGRATAVIRSGGESVAPDEVEAVLRRHPAVADVAVVGLPHDRWGEVVCAAVVAADGLSAPDVDELRRHCAGQLATFKHPRVVVALDAIPRTPATLQIQRKQVVALAQSSLGGAAPL
jgi:acyl-CoA synthetase (AMP-forming)/AMP-acid ligase II